MVASFVVAWLVRQCTAAAATAGRCCRAALGRSCPGGRRSLQGEGAGWGTAATAVVHWQDTAGMAPSTVHHTVGMVLAESESAEDLLWDQMNLCQLKEEQTNVMLVCSVSITG